METKFKVGDKVWSLTKGEGEVIRINNEDYGVVVRFKEMNCSPPPCYYFAHDGTYNSIDIRPEIYLAKPEVIIPKIKVKREVKRWVRTNPALIGYFDESAADKRLHDYECLPDWPALEVTITWEEETNA